MLRGFVLGIVGVVLVSVTQAHGVLGDLNRDGVVDFDDFFMFADNFGKLGPPEVDVVYDTLTVEVEQIRTVYDTLTLDVVTVFDTVIFGREPIRFDPPPPAGEITQSLVIAPVSYQNDWYWDYLIGEVRNEGDVSVSGLTFRLTVRDEGGAVRFTDTVYSGVDRTVPSLLIAGDTRPFWFYFRSGGDEGVPLDDLRSGNYSLELIWDEVVEQVNNVSVQLDTSNITYGVPFSIAGEIRNTSDLSVTNYTVYFYGRDADGNGIYYKYAKESTFGIPPGGTSPFFIKQTALETSSGPYRMITDLAELYYYVQWQWNTSSSREYETSPLTRIF